MKEILKIKNPKIFKEIFSVFDVKDEDIFVIDFGNKKIGTYLGVVEILDKNIFEFLDKSGAPPTLEIVGAKTLFKNINEIIDEEDELILVENPTTKIYSFLIGNPTSNDYVTIPIVSSVYSNNEGDTNFITDILGEFEKNVKENSPFKEYILPPRFVSITKMLKSDKTLYFVFYNKDYFDLLGYGAEKVFHIVNKKIFSNEKITDIETLKSKHHNELLFYSVQKIFDVKLPKEKIFFKVYQSPTDEEFNEENILFEFSFVKDNNLLFRVFEAPLIETVYVSDF